MPATGRSGRRWIGATSFSKRRSGPSSAGSPFSPGGSRSKPPRQWVGEGIRGDEVLELLTSLVDKSLVLVAEQDGEARYRLLETVSQYGREKLRECGESDQVGTARRVLPGIGREAEPEHRGAGSLASEAGNRARQLQGRPRVGVGTSGARRGVGSACNGRVAAGGLAGTGTFLGRQRPERGSPMAGERARQKRGRTARLPSG